MMGLSIIYFKGSQYGFPNYDVFKSPDIVLTSANSVDPDEMQHYTAFHPALRCISSRSSLFAKVLL